jgi:hypothetical protein
MQQFVFKEANGLYSIRTMQSQRNGRSSYKHATLNKDDKKIF